MIDILRELEKVDVNNTVSIHIFVTQFYEKFDLRTILLVRYLNYKCNCYHYLTGLYFINNIN